MIGIVGDTEQEQGNEKIRKRFYPIWENIDTAEFESDLGLNKKYLPVKIIMHNYMLKIS